MWTPQVLHLTAVNRWQGDHTDDLISFLRINVETRLVPPISKYTTSPGDAAMVIAIAIPITRQDEQLPFFYDRINASFSGYLQKIVMEVYLKARQLSNGDMYCYERSVHSGTYHMSWSYLGSGGRIQHININMTTT